MEDYYDQVSQTLDQWKEQLNATKDLLSGPQFESKKEKSPFEQKIKEIRAQIQKTADGQGVTKAWLKMWEMLNIPQISQSLSSQSEVTAFFNADWPGAFALATNHFVSEVLNKPFKWLISSYYPREAQGSYLDDMFGLSTANPANTLVGEKKMGPQKVWISGDLTNEKMPFILSSLVKNFFPNGVFLYTADGGFDVSGKESQQEVLSIPLIIGEIETGFRSLAIGGIMILKFFTYFTKDMLNLLNLLGYSFQTYDFFKPQTSSLLNSELYFIGIGFKGASNEILMKLNKKDLVNIVPFDKEGTLWQLQFMQNFLGIQIDTINNFMTDNLPTLDINFNVPPLSENKKLKILNDPKIKVSQGPDLEDIVEKTAEYIISRKSNFAKKAEYKQVLKKAMLDDQIKPPVIFVNQIAAELPYQEKVLNVVKTVIHNGQRKLFLSELVLLNKIVAPYFIYAGAAPSVHTSYLARLFPDIKFLLVDPNNFALHNWVPHRITAKNPDEVIDEFVNRQDQICIYQDFFTVELAEAIGKKFANTNFLFVSDIRTGEDEFPTDLDVAWNLAQQFNWVHLMNPTAYLLKFRHFYYNEKDIKSFDKISEQQMKDFNLAKSYGVDFIENYKNKSLTYFNGDMYVQAWAPLHSSEARLMGSGFDLTDWGDANTWENLFFYFNRVSRPFETYENNNADPTIGFDLCPDCAFENWVWTEFLTKGTSKLSVKQHVVELSKNLNNRPLLIDGHGHHFSDKIKYLEKIKGKKYKQKATKTPQERSGERLYHLKRLIPANIQFQTYLDFGAGNGEITKEIAKNLKVSYYLAMDVYPKEKAAKDLSYLPVDQINQLPENSIQLVTAFVVLHHVPLIKEALNNIKRVLVPNGLFFIREHDINRSDKQYLDQIHRDFDHGQGSEVVHYFSRKELKDLLTTFGFQHVGDSDYEEENPQGLYHSLFQLQK